MEVLGQLRRGIICLIFSPLNNLEYPCAIRGGIR